MIISVDRVTKTVGDRVLFEDVSFSVNAGERWAFVGPNGTGKTTMLDVVAGRLGSDAGTVSSAKGISIGYLEQEAIDIGGVSVLAHVLAVRADLADLEREIREIETSLGTADSRTLSRYGELQERFEREGGYDREVLARTVLGGLGFSTQDISRPVEEFSGGWLMRVALARLLVLDPDILLLDEPTNHLDLMSVEWLESFLKGFEGAMVIVSHDRTFLSGLVDHIADFSTTAVRTYTGAYGQFVAQRELEADQVQAAYKNQQRKIAEQERFIERFRYKNTKAKQVQSRVKVLDKMERVEIEAERKKVHFSFRQPPRTGQEVVNLHGVRKAYGDNVVYDSLELQLYRGDKVALTGENGAGKSTLLKMIAGVLPCDDGEIAWGHKVERAYFAQKQLEELDPDRTVLEEIDTVTPGWTEQEQRTLLGAFLFRGDDVRKKIAVLSGGERSRLALAKMLARPAPLLCVDEPTNHLDVESRDVLEEALEAFEGTIVLITHDRHLIRSVANKVVDVADGGATVYDGDYDYYLYKREQLARSGEYSNRQGTASSGSDARTQRGEKTASAERVGPKTRDQKRAEAKRRNELYGATKEARTKMAALDREIEGLRAKVRELETVLADPSLYGDQDTFGQQMSEYSSAKSRLHEAETEWIAAAESIESLEP